MSATYAINWRPAIILVLFFGVAAGSWVLLNHIGKAEAKAPGIVGEMPLPRTLKIPNLEPSPTVRERVESYLPHMGPQTPAAPAPKASPTPCRACQEVMDEYLKAIQTPFPNHRDTFVAPSMAAPAAMAAGAGTLDGNPRN